MLSRQYVAGFFDGEGCVNITVRGKVRQVCLRVMIVNTDASILQKINLSYGGRLTKPHSAKDGWKLTRQLVFMGAEAFNFLISIYPYLEIKKRQAKLAIDFWNFQSSGRNQRCEFVSRPIPKMPGRMVLKRTPQTVERELQFKAEMHELNRKGMPIQ